MRKMGGLGTLETEKGCELGWELNMIRGEETEERLMGEETGRSEGEEAPAFSGDGGGNGSLTVFHSTSSISITLWISV